MSDVKMKNIARSYGTFPLRGDELTTALTHAINTGYRAIDTAQMYRNEAETGACIAASGIPVESFCITTKVSPHNFSEAKFLSSVEQSLKDLQMLQVDLLLLHWPPQDGDIRPSVKLLETAAREGLAQHVGVSNYTASMMREARQLVSTPLVTNQVEFHPLLNQDTLLAAAAETGIPLSAYCSVARGEVFKYPQFTEIGQRHNKSAAQVVLRWILQKGVNAITMSRKPQNIETNFNITDFSLTESEIAEIDQLTKTGYRIVDKSVVPWAPDWDR